MNLVKQLRTWDEMPEDDSDSFHWLDVKTAEAADLIERQAAQIEMLREALKESGRLYCTMIGNDFINQPSMFERSVVAKYVRGWFRHNQPSMVKEALSTTPEQALEQFAAKVREQCAQMCEAEYVNVVDGDDEVYNSAITHASRAIRAITELPK